MKVRSEERGARSEPGSGTGLTRSSILDPRSSKGFTLIELIVVIIIIVVMIVIFRDRMQFYQ